MGKLVATRAMMLKKFFWNALMVTSATLRRWKCGSTSSSMQCCCIRVFMLSEHSLSRMWYCVVMPVALILLRRMMYPLCILVSVLFFGGLTSVVLVSASTMIMVYLYPCW